MQPAILQTGKIVATGSRGFWGMLMTIATFIARSWRFSVPLVILSFMLFGSIVESIQDRSAKPFLNDFVGRVLSFNHKIATESQRIIDDEGIVVDTIEPIEYNWFTKPFKYFGHYILVGWRTFLSVMSLIFNLIMFFWLFFLMYKVSIFVFTHNNSAVTANVLISILLVYIITTIGGFAFIYPQYEKETGTEFPWWNKINPFYGFFKLAKAIPYLKPIYTIRTEKIQDVIQEGDITFV